MKLSDRLQECWDSMFDADIPDPVVSKRSLDEWIAHAEALEAVAEATDRYLNFDPADDPRDLRNAMREALARLEALEAKQ